MKTHKTNGIVLHHFAYGESSIISVVYTELFGIQSYILKGIRKSTKAGQAKLSYFRPGANLEMVVYQNPFHNLQFIKEYQWHRIYDRTFSQVTKNLVLIFTMEVLKNTLTEPESNPELFEEIENLLQILNDADETATANFSIFFINRLLNHLGFGINDNKNTNFNVFDIELGIFTDTVPFHGNYIEGVMVEKLKAFININTWQSIKSNATTRNLLLETLLKYLQSHIPEFKPLKSLNILQSIFTN